MRTERPLRASRSPRRYVPSMSPDRAAFLSTSQRKTSLNRAALRKRARSDGGLLSGFVIKSYEVAECDRKVHILSGAEGVKAEPLLEPCHQNGETQRIEPRIEQDEVVGQRRQPLVLLLGDLLDLSSDRCPRGHCFYVRSVIHVATHSHSPTRSGQA